MSTDIYQQSIKQLATDQTAGGTLANPDAKLTLDNPLCGDRVTVEIIVTDDKIEQLAHQVRGCLLCQASASVIGSAAPGCSLHQIERISGQLNDLLNSDKPIKWHSNWQALANFEPVRYHKSRHGCVLLPFKALTQSMAAQLPTHPRD